MRIKAVKAAPILRPLQPWSDSHFWSATWGILRVMREKSLRENT